MDDPKRARSWKRRKQPRDNLKAVEPVPYSTSRDCHIEADWVLIYTADKDSLRLERTGTHSDLFKK